MDNVGEGDARSTETVFNLAADYIANFSNAGSRLPDPQVCLQYTTLHPLLGPHLFSSCDTAAGVVCFVQARQGGQVYSQEAFHVGASSSRQVVHQLLLVLQLSTLLTFVHVGCARWTQGCMDIVGGHAKGGGHAKVHCAC